MSKENKNLLPTTLASVMSGSVAKTFIHPFDTIKTKMQIQLTSKDQKTIGLVKTATNTFQQEGIKGLYRGLLVSVFGSAPSFASYMTMYEYSKNNLTFIENEKLRFFVSGMLAESIACLIWVPSDVVKERLQVQSNLKLYNYSGGIDAFRQILGKEGIKGLYRGYGASLVYFGPWSALYFMFYEIYKKEIIGNDKQISFSKSFCAAALASISSSFFTNFIDVAKVRLQVSRVSQNYQTDQNQNNPFKYNNIFHGLSQMFKNEGFSIFLKGFSAKLLQVAPQAAISMSLTEFFRQKITKILQE